MSSPPLNSSSLRDLFDELIDLTPEQRDVRFASLKLPDAAYEQLRAMLVFDELITLEAEQREAHLRGLDLSPSERAQLQAMLDTDTAVPGFLRASAAEAIHRLSSEEDDALGQSLIGTSIGSFQLIEMIGQGGSSAVFRAARKAGDGSQIVALKLLRTGLYSADAQRRFRREQAFLAQLTHPNIASLIEGGVSSAGIPYIAMELVDGIPITQAADARGLTVAERLQWFVTLCRTIESAHSALIVHRDLKPSNLLVTQSGDLKVLDFGIAKLVDNHDGVTRTQSISLTPEYAAPEQFKSAPLTTAVDVYALGIVLGELLTGQRLTGLLRASSVVAAASSNDASLPHGLPSRLALAKQLRGDLDSILKTALAEDATMRYRSAGAFADDVERHLVGRTVRAHPPSRWYRTRKFVSRHRTIVMTSSILLVALVAALGVALWQADVARRHAQSAREQAERAEAVRDLLVSVFNAAGADLPKDKRPNVQDIVDQATLKLTAQNAIPDATRIDLLLTLAKVAYSVGSYDRSLALLDHADSAIESVYGEHSSMWLDAKVLRASALADKAMTAEAAALLEPLRERLLVQHDAVGVQGLTTLGNSLRNQGHTDEGVELVHKALVIAQEQTPQVPEVLLPALINEATLLINAQRFKEGLESAETALTYWQKQGAPASQSIIGLYGTIALAAEAAGDISRAENAYKEAIALGDRFFDKANPAAAWNIGMYGSFLIAQGRTDEAEPYALKGLEMRREVFGQADPRTLSGVAAMVKMYSGKRDFAKAVEWGTQGVDTCRANAVNNVICPRLLALRGRSYSNLGRFVEADNDLRDALESQSKLSGDTSPAYAYILDNLVVLKINQHDYDGALSAADRVLAINLKAKGGMIQADLTTRFHRAEALYGLSRNDEAVTELLEIEPKYSELFPSGGLRFDILSLKARALNRAQRFADASDAASRALAIDNKPANIETNAIETLKKISLASKP
jgi:eukaryotic-like serine/threonine-protein kinase